MAKNPEHAYVTLLMTDNYLPGAMVLAHSLKDNGTTKQLVALITLDTVSATSIEELKTIYDQVIPIERTTNSSPGNLYLMGREDLASTFSKITLWKLSQFSRVVYLDADIIALRAPDELFDLKSNFAAAPDVGWPDIFNSGMMALTPNLQDYYALQALARNNVSFDGGDQGLLNMHFTRNLWERLSFTYNCTPSGNYQYAPAYRHFGSQISLVHFIGRQKPWQAGRHNQGSGVYQELTARWWSVYDKHYRGQNNTAVSGGRFAPRRTVQQYVNGEANTYDIQAPASTQQSQQRSQHEPQQQSSEARKESQQTEPTKQQWRIPTMVLHAPPEDSEPIVKQRRWSAPHVEWDPARAPPPENSKPEAENFPTNIYTMSEDKNLYKPPQAYPEPPKDMWYQVPEEKAPSHEKPKAIFPWEATQARATRVFPDEAPLPPVPDPDRQPPPMPALDTSASGASKESSSPNSSSEIPSAPSIPTMLTSESFASYRRTNAWDEIPGIGKYIEAYQSRRKPRHSPAGSVTSIIHSDDGKDRRPSLLLTDFPTEIERPSLPVTPAPVRKEEVFWGEEKRPDQAMPSAEGVPSQETWDPSHRLDELQRRQSATFLAGPGTVKSLPSRVQITSAVPETVEEDTDQARVSSESTSVVTTEETPVFGTVQFGGKETANADEPENLATTVKA